MTNSSSVADQDTSTLVRGPGHILIEGMELFAHHGNTDAERKQGVHLTVDVDITVDLRPAALSDDLADTVDYEACVNRVREVVDSARHHLLETVAHDIAVAMLKSRLARAVTVTVSKRPPVPVTVRRFAITVTLLRDDQPTEVS